MDLMQALKYINFALIFVETLTIDNIELTKQLILSSETIINMQDTNDTQLSEYEVLLNDVKKLEAEILPQLDMLSTKLPQIYKDYANVVRKTVSAAINILNTSSSKAGKVMIAAEIGARTIEAYGMWKEAAQHNKMLDRFMVVKKDIADLNLNKIEKASYNAQRSLARTKERFNKFAALSYDLAKENADTIKRVANLQLKMLVLYRTNLFLAETCKYLLKEYTAWKEYKQTSNEQRPDYYVVNQMIIKELFGKKVFGALEEAGDSEGRLTGGQILLLSDPQLAVFCLKDTLCYLNYSQASYAVGTLISNNPGLSYYDEESTPIIKKIKNQAVDIIYLWGFLTFLIVLSLCIWYIPGSWIPRVIIGTLSSVAVFKITSKNAMKLKVDFVTETVQEVAEVDDRIESYCGRVEQPQIDYNRKNALTSALNSFFKL